MDEPKGVGSVCLGCEDADRRPATFEQAFAGDPLWQALFAGEAVQGRAMPALGSVVVRMALAFGDVRAAPLASGE